MKTILLFISVFILVGFVNANTIIVVNTSDSGIGSLRQAVIDANSNDTIRFDSSLISSTSDTIILLSEITFSKPLIFKGLYNSSDTLYISGDTIGRYFNITSTGNVSLDSLVFINGSLVASNGGAISFVNSDTLFLNNSIVRGDSATTGYGGGVYVESVAHTALIINNSVITENYASSGGGIYLSSTDFVYLMIINSIITNNSAASEGGGVYVEGIDSSSTVKIKNSIISENSASDGGGIYTYSSYAHPYLVVDSSDINKNSALTGNGGAIASASNLYNEYSTVVVTNSKINDNSAFSNGGGIYSQGSYSTVSLTNSIINNNSSNEGGAVYSEGLYRNSFVKVTNSSIFGDTAYGGGGGGIYSESDNSIVTINNSTISSNSALQGGGVYSSADNYYSITVTNSTISSNSASDGGGIYSYLQLGNSSSLAVTNSTIYDNSASNGNGGGIFCDGSSDAPTIKSSIVWTDILGGSSMGVNTLIPIYSDGYNIFSDMPSGYDVSLDQINVTAADLNLQSLAFNGGETQTMLPNMPSLAINQGNPTDITDAQNRPIVGLRDVGSAEYNCKVSESETKTVCGSYICIDGNTYTSDTLGLIFTSFSNVTGICDTVYTLDLTVNPKPDTSTFLTGTTITSNAVGATYQWIDCENDDEAIVGATSQSYTATDYGDYAVVLDNGYCIDTSACVLITSLGISENKLDEEILLFPNPTNGKVTLSLPKSQTATIKIYNSLGQEIMDTQGSEQVYEFDLPYEKGIYFVKVYTNSYIQTFRVIKQ